MKRLWLFVIIVLLHDTRVTTTDCEKHEVKLYPGEEKYIDPNCRCYRTRTVYRINYSYLSCTDLILYPEQELIAETESIEENLKYLTVVNSHIGIIPSGTLRNYNTLQELYFNNTGVSKIHGGAFTGLSSLKKLYLQENNITKLPDDVFNTLYNLEALNISHNAIETIEENAFFGLINLTSVDLSHNNLKQFSQTVFYQTLLEFLDLSFNSIFILPEKFIEKANDSLNLNLSNNNFTQVDFTSVTSNLKGLNLKNNYISSVTNWKYLKNVKELDLSNNRLENVTVPTTLQHFNFSNNKLSSIQSDTFKLCKNLTILDVSYNTINDLDQDGFVALTNLQELNMAHNSLPLLPVGCFRDLISLSKLSLSFNDISELEYGNFVGLKRLKWLDISGNRLTFLNEDTFFELQSLLSLNISYNNLSTFDSSDIKEHLPNLQILDLGENPWICKSLLEIVKTLEKSDINIVQGTTLKFNSLKGKCVKDNSGLGTTVEKSKINDKESINLQNLVDTAVKASFNKYFQNFTVNRLDLNKTAKSFLENFNSGFRNTDFYQYFNSNHSEILNKSIDFTNVKDDLKNLDAALKNLSLIELTDNFGQKLHKLINADFTDSEFYNFFKESFKNSAFFKTLYSERNPSLIAMKQYFDADFKESAFFKFFTVSLNQSVSKMPFGNVDANVGQKLLEAIANLSNVTAQNVLGPHSEFLSDNGNSVTKEQVNKMVTLVVILIIVVIIGLVIIIFRKSLEEVFSKKKLSYFREGGSSIRITRADMEMS